MTTRKLPNIIVTGTPGVGKTSHCEVLAESTGMRYLNISRIVKERQLYESWDERLLSWNVDELRLLRSIRDEVEEGGNIIDWHHCDLFPKRWIDLVVVLRASTEVLYDRLDARGYNKEKLDENMMSEIMQIILEEARSYFDEEVVVELSSDTAEDLESNIERIETWIENWKQNNSTNPS